MLTNPDLTIGRPESPPLPPLPEDTRQNGSDNGTPSIMISTASEESNTESRRDMQRSLGNGRRVQVLKNFQSIDDKPLPPTPQNNTSTNATTGGETSSQFLSPNSISAGWQNVSHSNDSIDVLSIATSSSLTDNASTSELSSEERGRGKGKGQLNKARSFNSINSFFSKKTEGSESKKSEPSASTMSAHRTSGSKNQQTFIRKFSVPLLQSSLATVSTSKGLKNFCDELQKKGIDADTLLGLRNAIEGKKDAASAPVLGTVVGTVTTAGKRHAAEIEENVLGIAEVANRIHESFDANYPLTGNGIKRQRAILFMKKLLELCHENNRAYQSRAEGLGVLKTELEFWSAAEIRLLEEGMPMDQIVATRENFLNAMFALSEKESHLKQIAYKCTASAEVIYNTMDDNITSIDDLLRDYKETKASGANVNYPSEEDIQSLRLYIEGEVSNKGLGTGTALLGTHQYEVKTEEIMSDFKNTWLSTWKQNEKSNACAKLQGWPQDLIDRLVQLDLMSTAPGKKTEYINDLRRDGETVNRVWVLDTALAVANQPETEPTWFSARDVKLTKDDAEGSRQWVSKLLGKAIEKMEKSGDA